MALILIAWFVEMPLWLSITITVLAGLKILKKISEERDMKIIKKPKIEPQTCQVCGTVVEVEFKDLTIGACSLIKDTWVCPICKKRNIVKWAKE